MKPYFWVGFRTLDDARRAGISSPSDASGTVKAGRSWFLFLGFGGFISGEVSSCCSSFLLLVRGTFICTGFWLASPSSSLSFGLLVVLASGKMKSSSDSSDPISGIIDSGICFLTRIPGSESVSCSEGDTAVSFFRKAGLWSSSSDSDPVVSSKRPSREMNFFSLATLTIVPSVAPGLR